MNNSKASLGSSIRRGFGWLFLGTLGNRIMQFVFSIILARLLVPADFGTIATVAVLTGVASLVTSGGMGQSIIRAKEVDETDFCAVFTLQLLFCSLWYVVFFISSPYIAIFFNEPIYSDLIRVSTLVFLLKPLTYMRMAWLNREMEFKKRSVVNIITALMSGVLSVLMAWYGMGVWSLILSGLFSAIFNNILLGMIVPIRFKLTKNTAIMKKHSSFGIKITAIDILGYLSREGKTLIISKVAGTAFVGIFKKAESQARLPNDIIMPSMMQPVFRALAKVQDDLDQTKYLLYRSITLVTVITAPLYIGLWWVAETFIVTLYGGNWSPSVEPLRILVFAGVFFNFLYPFGILLSAQDKLAQEVVVSILRLLITIVACLIGLNWGLSGAAIGIVFSYACATIMLYYIVSQTISTRIFDLFKAFFPGMLLGTILFLMLGLVDFLLGDIETAYPILYLLTMSTIGAITYIVAFLSIPIHSLNSEVQRFRKIINQSREKIIKFTIETYLKIT